ncbi:MAG: IMP dehydrogenase [Alphaproteobacteria bacterium]
MVNIADIPLGLTFDDVLLEPAKSALLPSATSLATTVGPHHLHLPTLSAAMDTATEARMAIAIAQEGGMGVIHRNMTVAAQAAEVGIVKRFEAGMVVNPITIAPSATLAQAKALMREKRISGLPVVVPNGGTVGKLVGILTNRDVRFAKNDGQPVSELMTKNNLVTISINDVRRQGLAKKLLHENRIEKLLVVDATGHCVGLITVKDIEKSTLHPHASKDTDGRLLVAAAVGTGEAGLARAKALVEAGADCVVVDSAHGHSRNVAEMVQTMRQLFPQLHIMAGNIATAAAAQYLIEAGANTVKVGIGPGSICTTRIVAGVGVPQFTAVVNVANYVRQQHPHVGVVADGGIRYSGDIVKALAAGADAVMLGSMLAGTDEAPGDMYMYQGRPYKAYRGMGSMGAMQVRSAQGTTTSSSADRYFQAGHAADKLVPEGIEGQVPYKGPVANILHQLKGGVQAGLGYLGAEGIKALREHAQFVRVTPAAQRESHPHGVTITREAPNYNS